MPETTYNPSITVDTGLYCPVCRGAIQANLTDSSIGPIIWDAFCNFQNDHAHQSAEPFCDVFSEFITQTAPRILDFSWAREAWDNYHKEKANV